MNDELNELLKSTGISKQKAAEMAGVVPSTVTRRVNGVTPVPPLVIEKLRRIDKIIRGD